jgi:hypothetical protein
VVSAGPEPETIALNLTCAECGRSPRPGETWRILFADVGEAFIFCPECAEREFGPLTASRDGSNVKICFRISQPGLNQRRKRRTFEGPDGRFSATAPSIT